MLYLPLFFIPTSTHFCRRQCWHLFLVFLSISQHLLALHTYFASARMLLLKKLLHASQLMTPKCIPEALSLHTLQTKLGTSIDEEWGFWIVDQGGNVGWLSTRLFSYPEMELISWLMHRSLQLSPKSGKSGSIQSLQGRSSKYPSSAVPSLHRGFSYGALSCSNILFGTADNYFHARKWRVRMVARVPHT